MTSTWLEAGCYFLERGLQEGSLPELRLPLPAKRGGGGDVPFGPGAPTVVEVGSPSSHPPSAACLPPPFAWLP